MALCGVVQAEIYDIPVGSQIVPMVAKMISMSSLPSGRSVQFSILRASRSEKLGYSQTAFRPK